jgi:shikimate kinase
VRLDDGRIIEGSVALIGFMGAGKSAVGPLLAGLLGFEYVDLDDVVMEEAGKSIVEIFDVEGEKGFRDRERKALESELSLAGKVLSCGGGVVLRDDNIELLRSRCRVFLLRISPEEAIRRVSVGGGRPLLEEGNLEETVRELMSERASRYECAAHDVIEADNASPESIAEEIAERWWRYRSERRVENTPST